MIISLDAEKAKLNSFHDKTLNKLEILIEENYFNIIKGHI